MRYLPLTLLPLLVVACGDQNPVAPDASPLFSATAGMKKVPISGTVLSVDEPPDLKPPLVTPSGMCHIYASPGIIEYTGDMAGIVTVHRRVVNVACSFDPNDIGSFAGSGPFDGEVTFQGRTGTIKGMWTVICKPDPVTVWACGGTSTARGSGGLAVTRRSGYSL